ncbi:MAG: sensor histidine kinase [Eubacterium sp.]|nr:sensor histidine kinase [Eubacterium sp.]
MNDEKKKKKSHLSLGQKVTSLIVSTMVFCAMLWTVVMFVNMARNAKDNALIEERAFINSVQSDINSVEEVCNLAKQMISQNASIVGYMEAVKSGKDLSTVEKIDFYNTELAHIDNMTNLNPYLYQLRLFVNADVTEKKPCFYRIDRLENMTWYGKYQDDSWVMNYYDTAFADGTNHNTKLAGLIKNIYDNHDHLLAVLEVSTDIENLIPNFYKTDNGEWNFFVNEKNQIVCSDENEEFLKAHKEEILTYLKYKDESNYLSFMGEDAIVSTMDMDSLKGTYVHIALTEKMVQSYYRSQIPYVLVVIFSMIVFSGLVIFLIRHIFKRFNTLTSSVNRIKNGEHILLPDEGDDEITDMARQINDMVRSLEKLNKETVENELLMKNTEIKALQNQINAHFMYNVLETIKMLAEIKEDYEISDAVTSLGEMFRYSVKWSSGMVELKEEIKYIRNYLNLLNLRFDYEIFLSLNIPQEYMKLKIPKMSLQPLVENSVYHGIEDIAEDTYIYIKVYEEGDVISIEVSDAGVGMSEETLQMLRNRLNSVDSVSEDSDHGRALYNVMQRIKMYFGPEYGIEIYSKEGIYTKVVIQIPKEKEKEE